MTDTTPYPVRLARDISGQIDQLGGHLAQAPPRQAAQILGQVLDADEGILGRLTTLVATGSQFAQDHTERGTFPPEVWLALGRAANDLSQLCVNLDEHAGEFRQLAQTPSATCLTMTPTPVASALVVARRRR
ncbi:hypothetical protein OG427_07270 [Streptomyces sp. NBC_00133]|uniref:hypothetical protein n=1 Tax=Streptomyces sp. NBC_00133 TaxID=2903624 RepID=UPI0032473E46